MTRGAAIITGGAGSLGRAIGIALAADGCDVWLWDRDEAAVGEVADEIGARSRACDVTDPESRARALDAAGSPAVLVNCAGIAGVVPFFETDAALWERMLAVNLTAPMFLTQEVARRMAAGGSGGRVVNVASVSGLRASFGRTAYGVTKAGIIQLTRQSAVELAAFGINVNAVAPGPVEGPMARLVHPPEQVADYIATIPQARYAQAEEIAGAVAFLCGPAARHVTGQCLAVDGGWSAAGIGVVQAQQAASVRAGAKE